MITATNTLRHKEYTKLDKNMHRSKIILIAFIILNITQAQDFNTGNVYLQVTNAGSTLFGSPDSQNLQITRISTLISGAENEVFDYLKDADWADTTAMDDTTQLVADYQVVSNFDNSYSNKPPAYKVELKSYGWLNDSFAISRYRVMNTDSVTFQSKFGFEILPFIENYYGNEKIEYDADLDYIRIFRDTSETYMGIKVLSHEIASLFVEDWVSGYNKSDTALYSNLFHESIVDTFTAADSGSVLIPSIDTQEIRPGGTYEVYIALGAALNKADLDTVMMNTADRYEEILLNTSVDDELEELPNHITLYQNYPNPFNPSTTIQFTISETNNVELSIYNVLGEKVTTIVDKELNAGRHKVEFNASRMSSGVYFYRLKTANKIISKKMLLIK